MDAARYQRVAEVFDHARGLPAGERTDWLESECGADADLREKVLALLGAEQSERSPFVEERIESGRAQLQGILPPLRAPQELQQIGKYRILRRVGLGGMGVVYEAEQEQPTRRVALKLLPPEHAHGERLRRFRRESEIMAALLHPGIAQVYEADTVDLGSGPQPYFAMEFVDGVPLTLHAERASLDLRERLALVAELCNAVQHAHDRGIVHRDLKPDNVLVDGEGRVKVLDFGIARALGTEAPLSTIQTSEGELLGTLTHMAPEQLGGDPDAVGPPADTYALGVIAYELLSGRLPFDLAGLPVTAAIRFVSESSAPRLSSVDPRLRGDVETIVAKALESQAERRYVTPGALRDDLRRFLAHQPILARRPSRLYLARRFARRRPALVAALLIAVVGVCGVLHFAVRADSARRLAEQQQQVADEQRLRAERNEVASYGGLYDFLQRVVEEDVCQAREMLLSVPESRRNWEWSWLQRRMPLLPEFEDADGTRWKGDSFQMIDERSSILYRPVASGLWDLYRFDLARPSRTRHLLESVTGINVQLGGRVPTHRGISGPEHGEALLFDLESERVLQRLPELAYPWQVLDWSPNDVVLAMNKQRSALRFHALGRGEAHVVERQGGGHAALSEDGRWVALAMDGMQHLHLYDALSGELLWDQELTPVLNVDFSPDGERIAVLQNTAVALLDRESGRVLRRLPLAPGPIAPAHHLSSLRFSGDGSALGVSTGRGHAQTFDPDTGEVLYDFGLRRIALRRGNKFSLSPSGRMAIVTALDSQDHWVVDTRDELDPVYTEFEAAWSFVYWTCVAPDGGLVAASVWGGHGVQVWDGWTGELLLTIERRGGSAQTTMGFHSFSADGRKLVYSAVAEDGLHRAHSLDLLTGALELGPDRSSVGTLDVPNALTEDMARLTGLAAPHLNGRLRFHPDGERIYASTPENWNTPSPREFSLEWGTEAWPQPWIMGLDVSPDGERVALGLKEGKQQSLVVLRCEDGSLAGSVEPVPGGEVMSVAWSPDGTRLAFGMRSGEIRVVETEHFTTMVTLPRHEDYVLGLCWSPDGEFLYSGSGDGTLRAWDSVHPIPRRFRTEDRTKATLEAAAQLAQWTAELGSHSAAAERLWAEAADDEARIVVRRACLASWAE